MHKQLQSRIEAQKMLRQAYHLAERGWIKKGRQSTHDMLSDCLIEVAQHGPLVELGRGLRPADSRMLSYVCLVLPRKTDSGSNRLRMKKIYQWEDWGYVTQDHVIRVLDSAWRLATEDVRRTRTNLKVAGRLK